MQKQKLTAGQCHSRCTHCSPWRSPEPLCCSRWEEHMMEQGRSRTTKEWQTGMVMYWPQLPISLGCFGVGSVSGLKLSQDRRGLGKSVLSFLFTQVWNSEGNLLSALDTDTQFKRKLNIVIIIFPFPPPIYPIFFFKSRSIKYKRKLHGFSSCNNLFLNWINSFSNGIFAVLL